MAQMRTGGQQNLFALREVDRGVPWLLIQSFWVCGIDRLRRTLRVRTPSSCKRLLVAASLRL